jgi:uncharacterized protein
MGSQGAEAALDRAYAIPVLGEALLFAPLAGFSAVVGARALEGVRDALAGGGRGARPSDEGVLSILRELAAAPRGPADPSGPPDPAMLGIIASRRCDMSCAYCDFPKSSDAGESMPPSIAVAAVDAMALLAEENGRREYTIQFFGGEPFVERELVEIVVHRARLVASRTGVFPIFEACTNGAFDEDWGRFVADYFGRVILSLDGTAAFQDRNRPLADGGGSFDRVLRSAKSLALSPVELSLRCCVTNESVGAMTELTRWFCSEIGPDVIGFEPLTENGGARRLGLSSPDPYDYARGLIGSFRVMEEYGVKPACASLAGPGPRTSSCAVGKDALIVFPDGGVASCYLDPREWEAKGLDMTIGRITASGSLELDRGAVERLRTRDEGMERCRGCFCRDTCAGGCRVNNTYPGCSEARNDFCVHTRIVTACSLLDGLGFRDLADRLLSDPSEMEALASRRSDLIAEGTRGP